MKTRDKKIWLKQPEEKKIHVAYKRKLLRIIAKLSPKIIKAKRQ